MPTGNSYIDSFWVRNRTKRDVTLGDLVNAVIPARRSVDLLKVPGVTKDKINQSKSLALAEKQKLIAIEGNKTPVDGETSKLIVGSGSSSGQVGPQGPQGPQGETGEGVIPPSTSVFTRDENGAISAVAFENGRTVIINRTLGQISSVVDSATGTYTMNRDIDGTLTGVSFS